MKRERSPLKKGDKVKFVGWSEDERSCYLEGVCDTYVEVLQDWNPEMLRVQTAYGPIDRRQVIAVKRKKQRREFWTRCCIIADHDRVFHYPTELNKPYKSCDQCEILKVQVVKE